MPLVSVEYKDSSLTTPRLGKQEGFPMLATRLTCPHCSKQLKLRQPPIAGRRILCSGCKRSFPVRSEDAAAAAAEISPERASTPPACAPTPLPSSILTPTAPPAGLKATPSAIRTPALANVPVLPPRPTANHSGRPTNPLVLLGVILGGLFLLAGSTALALHLAAGKDARQAARPDDEIVQPIDPGDPAPARPSDDGSPPKDSEGSRPDDPPRDDSGRPPATDDPGSRPPAGRPKPADEPVSMKPPERGWLPRELQEDVNKAIDRGAEYLKKKQLATGCWENNHTTAYSALPALTLLECGVPASDPHIRKAAEFVRGHVKRVAAGSATYELSLALLFLDRLGDPKDRKIIRSIALRLVAGQTAEGG